MLSHDSSHIADVGLNLEGGSLVKLAFHTNGWCQIDYYFTGHKNLGQM